MTIWLILFSCKKHAADANPFWPCDIYNSDSTYIATKIVGSWKWTKYSCSTGNLMTADKNIRVTFNSNATFTVLENSSVIVQGTWSLKSAASNEWQLNLTGPSEYLKGFIMFCNNQVAFIDSYVDGCNHYFELTN